ncbi:MAG: TIGR02186 family protein [Nitrospirota bacterium]
MKIFKIKGTKYRIMVFLIFGFLMFNFAFLEVSSAILTTKVNSNHIKIDLFYHGDKVSVSGLSDLNVDLIIKITSPEEEQVLRKKGKVGGLLWMNVGNLKFEHVPDLYFLHSTGDIEDILSQEEMDKYVIGYEALNKHIEIKSLKSEGEKSRWFNEFVKFKESSRLYSSSSGKISLTEKNGKQNYYILLNWPYQATPGNYTVTAYAVKDRKVIETAQAEILVEQVGPIRAFANMAKNNGALFGAISIIVALGAGFGVGMIFRKGGGSH